MKMGDPRRVSAGFRFNGKNMKEELKDYLTSVTYTDVASGSSDQLDITIQNIEMDWLNRKYPVKGDRVDGTITFRNWEKEGRDKRLSCGIFVLDNIKYSGGPLAAQFGCLAIPANGSFQTRERTKTWKEVTVHGIAKEIAGKYGLQLNCSGPDVKINSIEQSQKTDSAFLYEICNTYGMSMKVYNNAIVIYDQTSQEKKSSSAELTRESFVDDNWEYEDALVGIYTGARISYKSGNDSEEISVYVGMKAENAAGSRVLKIDETADSVSDAYHKAAAKVNRSNESATKLSGEIWPNPKICAGATVRVKGMGKANGKYFVEKSTIEVSGSGTKQNVEMHRCQRRLSYAPKAAPIPASQTSRNYKTGDIVNFSGGMHYVSSHPGAKGQSAKAGPAKITLGPDSAGNGKAHPWHLVHTDNTSNVYGWVDEGSFS
ncbi:MAG: hypothetical protein K1W32_09925 [Schaedlerella sp.]|nr:hypothetical protein [Ruminococcus sp.]NBJ01969.1 hypothetical protein [Lachnospiraceae bacterium]